MSHSILSKIEISHDIIKGYKLAGDNLSEENLLSWYEEEEQAFSSEEVELRENNGTTKGNLPRPLAWGRVDIFRRLLQNQPLIPNPLG